MPAISSLTDHELLFRLKEGDQAAFAEIYGRYWDKLFAVANNRLRDEFEAEEVVQDVLFSLWKRREHLQIQYTLNTYLSIAAKYQVINRQARVYQKKNNLEFIDAVHEESVDTTQLWFAERELQEQLTQAIHKLPEKCRIVFLKSREEGKSNEKIAEELDISEKTVEAHITRALHTLKNSLQVSIPLLLFLLRK